MRSALLRRGVGVLRVAGFTRAGGSVRTMSAFDDAGRVLREEERSREAIYIKKREAELLQRLKTQRERLDEIKKALKEYKEDQVELEKWVENAHKE